MNITWIGHACFKIEDQGSTVVIDPYEDGSVPGLGNVRETADLVLCSHEHGDHNARGNVKLTGKACPFEITEIATYHDEVQGAKRGPNTIRIIDTGSQKIAHMGDLGCELTEEQKAQLTGLDVMMIPVGGFFTIDGAQAAELVKELKPAKVIPMHYRDEMGAFGYEVISTLAPFLEAMDGDPAVCVMQPEAAR